MYVLADVEWVENNDSIISFTQIAMVRVDENWRAIDSIYRRICPKDESFHQWNHVAYVGGSIPDFLNAPGSTTAFNDIVNWLLPDDIVCWWHFESMDWVKKLVPELTNKQIILAKSVASYLGDKGVGNPYRVGQQLYLDGPQAKHDSRNDVEMMRRVLEYIQFPQPIPKVPDIIPNHFIGVAAMAYHAHVGSNTIHKKGCQYIPQDGPLKGYNELIKPVGKGYIPCDCIKAEFRAARKHRNQSIIQRCQYKYLYTPNSDVFHRRDCKIMLFAKNIMGVEYYNKCIASNRRPCKICNPTIDDERKKRANKPKPKKKLAVSTPLSADELRAIGRHRQAQEERRALERNTAMNGQEREDHYTLTKTGYAFFAANGYTNFHLRHCKKLSGLSNIEGFARYKDASRKYSPCKCCKPSEKHDAVVSMPIYSTERKGESVRMIAEMCRNMELEYREEAGLSYIKTRVGIWRFNAKQSPYRLEHINLVVSPDNTTDFHRQPRLFLSLRDVVFYIKRHDDNLALTSQNMSAIK